MHCLVDGEPLVGGNKSYLRKKRKVRKMRKSRKFRKFRKFRKATFRAKFGWCISHVYSNGLGSNSNSKCGETIVRERPCLHKFSSRFRYIYMGKFVNILSCTLTEKEGIE